MVRRVEAIEAEITSRGPGAMDLLDDQVRKERGRSLPDWPEWCWYPSACAEALTDDRPDQARMVAAIGAWRQGRSIYRVDPLTAAALADTELPDEIPALTLLELPEWGLYLTGMRTDPPVNGVFVHLDWSFDRRRPELWIVVDVGELEETFLLLALPVFLDHPSLADSLAAAVTQAGPSTPEPGEERITLDTRTVLPGVHGTGDLLGIVRPVVAVLLYLCSAAPDVVDPDRPDARPRRARARGGQPRVWEVGYRISTAIRQPRTTDAAGDGQHRAPEAHLRRAHWHTYWVGSRAEPDQRRRELRWIQPTLIGTGKLQTSVRDLG